MPPPQATVTTAALEQFVATLDAPIDPADLRGIWSEPDNSGAESSSTSTTSTSHAWTSSSVAPSLPRSSSSGGMKEEQEDVVALVQTMGPSGSRRREDDSSSPRRRGRLTNLQRRGELQAEGEERVRRVVDEQLQHAVRADHRDFVRRLLDRMRGLRSRLHLYGVAVEQALTWWPRDEGDQPWNAALLEELVVREIVNVGTGMSSSSSSMAGGYSVLLQPGLPQGAAIDNQLPGVPRSVIAGLRRRVWQSHMANVEPFPPLDAPNPGRWRDAPLFFVPAAREVVPNLPPGCLPPEDPLTKRVREGVANRRRLQRLPRRRPVQEPHDYHVARARPARVTPLEPERDPPPEPAHVEAELGCVWDARKAEERGFLDRITSTTATNRPLQILHELEHLNSSVFCVPKLGGLDPPAANEVDRSITKLHNVLGACEKILRTPIYTPYTRFTSRFLFIWCNLLPLALFPVVGPDLTVPLTLTISFFMLGIEDIGSRVEQPFDVLPLWQYCEEIDNSLVQLLEHSRALGRLPHVAESEQDRYIREKIGPFVSSISV
eukprot:s4025_g9.t1